MTDQGSQFTRAQRFDNIEMDKDIKVARRVVTAVSFSILLVAAVYMFVRIIGEDYEGQTAKSLATAAVPLFVGMVMPGTFVVNMTLHYMEHLSKRYGCSKQ